MNSSEYWGPKLELCFSKENWHLLLAEGKDHLDPWYRSLLQWCRIHADVFFSPPTSCRGRGRGSSLSFRNTIDFCSQSNSFLFTYRSPLELSVHWCFFINLLFELLEVFNAFMKHGGSLKVSLLLFIHNPLLFYGENP